MSIKTYIKIRNFTIVSYLLILNNIYKNYTYIQELSLMQDISYIILIIHIVNEKVIAIN